MVEVARRIESVTIKGTRPQDGPAWLPYIFVLAFYLYIYIVCSLQPCVREGEKGLGRKCER